MRVLVAAVAVALLAVPAAAGAAPTTLTITYWPEGTAGEAKQTRTLRCNPLGGTLPARATACRKLAELQRPFAPVPKDAVCTQIYGGPQVALVRGTFRGQRIWTWFKRRNGCEIERWNRVKFLFPAPDA
jgi:hypothetical protein